jgi:type I restriction enzyme S subunit
MNAAGSGWRDIRLGEICQFKYGKSLPEAARAEGSVPVYGSNGVVGLHTEAITDGPAIVVGRKGSFGEVNFSRVACWPIDTTYYIDKTATSADLRWLAYRLSALGLNRLNRAAAVPGLNREDAYRKCLLLPPIVEQQRIAAILDKADALRAKRANASAQMGLISRSVYISLFGNPIKSDQNWPVRQFSEVGMLDRGISKHRPRNAPELLNGPYPFVQTGDVANCDGYIRRFTATYSETGLKQSRLWPKGTLCITIAANIAKTGILCFDACFPDSVVGFVPSKTVTTEYVQTWLSFLQSQLERTAPESAQKNINLNILRSLPIPVPHLELQREFSSIVHRLEALRSSTNASLQKLELLFATLQHRAFRGDL